MTKEEVAKVFKAEDYLTGGGVNEGLKIIAKYTDNLITLADRDFIRSEEVDVLCEAGITHNDIVRLAELGWRVHEADHLGSWLA